MSFRKNEKEKKEERKMLQKCEKDENKKISKKQQLRQRIEAFNPNAFKQKANNSV